MTRALVEAFDAKRQAVERLPSLALMEITADGIIAEVNEQYCALVGRAREGLVGHHVGEYTHPDDERLTAAALRRLGADDVNVLTTEKRQIRPDGTHVWVSVSAARCGDRIIGHVTDITELVDARLAAQAAERRSRALIENCADIIAVIDAEGRLMDANPAAARILGRSTEDHVGTSMLELVHPDDLRGVLEAMARAVATPGVQNETTYRMRTSDGGWVHMSSVGNNRLDDPAIRGIVINAHDVTEFVNNLRSLVGALARATEYRDPYTAGHQEKVAVLSRRIAIKLGLAPAEVSRIEMGASLHDIGKIAVPSEILTRPGSLSVPEWEIVKSHTTVGHEILTGVDFAAPITDIVRHHHERLDGSGYPDGLSGDEILIGARVVAVADVIDAISSHRPYRPSLGLEAAREELRRNNRVLYDPDVVDAALSVDLTTTSKAAA